MTTTPTDRAAGTATTTSPLRRSAAPPAGIDPRGPRLGAAVTAVLLLAVLLTPRPVATALISVQLLLFGTAVVRGVARAPLGWVFRTWVRPRLGPPTDLEDPRPPRFAQVVGLVFAVLSLLGYATGAVGLGQAAAACALVAALLNAALGLCLGCELYLAALRVRHRAG